MSYVFDAMYDRGKTGDTPSGETGAGDKATRPRLGFPAGLARVDPWGATEPRSDSIPDALRLDSSGKTVELHTQHIDDRLVALTAPSGLMAEEYRSIRTGILARWEHNRHLIHTITSATPQEGKTITSLNLGLIFGELYNRKTIVVEADLRLPQFKKLMSLPKSPGLVGVLKGEAPLSDSILKVPDRNISFLPAGHRANTQAVQLLAGNTMTSVFKTLRHEFDHVIVDTPPVVDLADAGVLGALSDDVLLVVRMNRTPRTLVEQAVRTLTTFNAPVAGLISTDQKRFRRRYYYQKYGYQSKYYHRYYAKAA